MATGRKRKKAVYRRRRQNRFSMFLVTLVVVMILVVVAVKRVELSAKLEANQAKIEQLNSQIADEEARAEEIKEFEKYTHTKGYVEEVAHDKLGLVYEGEIIFKQNE
ncbi:MAG: septum formation initiator family protein [Lachnospiraceae bacterium]